MSGCSPFKHGESWRRADARSLRLKKKQGGGQSASARSVWAWAFTCDLQPLAHSRKKLLSATCP
eukprot:1336929-Pleurochrysis_carterae.AAC.3